MLAKRGLGVHNLTSDTVHARALIFTMKLYLAILMGKTKIDKSDVIQACGRGKQHKK